MVAVFILATVFVGFYVNLKQGFASVESSRENLGATQVLMQQMETIKLYTWSQINSNGFVPTTFTTSMNPNTNGLSSTHYTANTLVYTGTVTIANSSMTESYAGDLVLVTVSVTWRSDVNNVTNTRQMSTYCDSGNTVCTITTIEMTAYRTNRGARGYTLFETVIAVGISVLAFGAVASMLIFGAKSTAIIGNYADMNRYDLRALDQMTMDIRQANSVVSCTSTQLQIQEVDMTSGTTNALTYTSPAARTLTRSYEGTHQYAPDGHRHQFVFQLTMYQRNPVGGSLSNYVTTNLAECKVVQMTWNSARSIIGIGETESVQSTRNRDPRSLI